MTIELERPTRDVALSISTVGFGAAAVTPESAEPEPDGTVASDGGDGGGTGSGDWALFAACAFLESDKILMKAN